MLPIYKFKYLTYICLAHILIFDIAVASSITQIDILKTYQPFVANDSSADITSNLHRYQTLQKLHQTISCTDDLNTIEQTSRTFFREQFAIDDCSFIDTELGLSLNESGFTGYFHLDQWTISKINGDGGVDVTGAPNSLLVEGANNTTVNVPGNSAVVLAIAIPASGYVEFNWSVIGGSNHFTNSGLTVDANGTILSNAAEEPEFFSSNLHPGQQFTITITNSKATTSKVVLNNFTFYTNASKVIQRNWTLNAQQGNHFNFSQFIAVENLSFANILFPENVEGITPNSLKNDPGVHPMATGIPYYDKDGNPTTTADQISLAAECDCALQVEWEDSFQLTNEGGTILRQWKVTDINQKNTSIATQIIKLYGHYMIDSIGPEKSSKKFIRSYESSKSDYSATIEASVPTMDTLF